MFEIAVHPKKSRRDWLVILWLISLVPWPLAASLGGMAFDGGYTTEAYVFAWSIWTYPITVLLAFFLRRKNRFVVLLPVLNAVVFFSSGFFHVS